jgi:thiol-disulfide isomerase/thioredoxin
MKAWRAVAAALVVVLIAAGCTRKPAPRPSPITVAACVEGLTGPTPPAPVGGTPVPGLPLPCLDGGAPVRLDQLGRPAVVNLWATWCGPCRQELPAFQGYADRVGERVRVIGVDTLDRAEASRPYVSDLRLRFPMLADPDGTLMRRVGVSALPATLFLDAQGRISYLYNGPALDRDGLVRLGRDHLGVVVSDG